MFFAWRAYSSGERFPSELCGWLALQSRRQARMAAALRVNLHDPSPHSTEHLSRHASLERNTCRTPNGNAKVRAAGSQIEGGGKQDARQKQLGAPLRARMSTRTCREGLLCSAS
jgi:hypothetical protein